MKNLYVGISSVRNAYNYIMDHLPSWLPCVIVPGSRDCRPEGELQELWRHLGIEEDTIEVLVELGLTWKDEHLHISKDASQPGVMSEFMACLMSVWRFVSFSDSKYLTIGPSTRRLTAAMLCGMGSCLAYARAQPGVSD